MQSGSHTYLHYHSDSRKILAICLDLQLVAQHPLRILSQTIFCLSEYRSGWFSLLFQWQRWEEKVRMTKPDEHHFSWVSRVKDRLEYEIDFGCWNRKIKKTKWIFWDVLPLETEPGNYTTDWLERHLKFSEDRSLAHRCAYVIRFFSEWRINHCSPNGVGNRHIPFVSTW